jgi:hypothetical protein
MSEMSDLLPKSQAASVAKLSGKSIERAIAGGELAAVREHGRIERATLGGWIAAREARGRPLRILDTGEPRNTASQDDPLGTRVCFSNKYAR